MLNRQKVILTLLKQAKRPVMRTELVKWAFLLRQEYPSAGGNAFYGFLPYLKGPFSFALYQEIGKLEDNGLVEQVGDDRWQMRADHTFKTPEQSIQADIDSLFKRVKNWDEDGLLDYVYETYPRYTVNSERRKMEARVTTSPAVFTAGYEGLSVDAFLHMLIENGIERLIDVRHNPIARRFGFHRSTLNRLSGNVGIEYIHVPELGIQSSQRQNLETMADRDALFNEYEQTTLVTNNESLTHVAELMQEKPSVLVCMEAAANCCHRSRVADHVSTMTSLTVQHLMP